VGGVRSARASKVTAIPQADCCQSVAPLEILHIARQIETTLTLTLHPPLPTCQIPVAHQIFQRFQLSIFAEGERISGGSLANICISDIYVATTLYIM